MLKTLKIALKCKIWRFKFGNVKYFSYICARKNYKMQKAFN